MFGSCSPLAGLWPLGTLGPPAPTPPAGPTTLRQAIYQRLNTDSSITALVGPRIYPAGRPQASNLPAITFIQAGSFEPKSLTRSTRNRSARIRISCWANGEEAAETLADAVRASLVDFRGRIGGMIIGYAGCEGDWDLPEPPTGGKNTYVYQIVLDLKFWSRRA